MNLDKMKELLPEGMTFINKSSLNSSMDINIQHTDTDTLDDVITEFREFLLGCGFASEGINGYFDEEL